MASETFSISLCSILSHRIVRVLNEYQTKSSFSVQIKFFLFSFLISLKKKKSWKTFDRIKRKKCASFCYILYAFSFTTSFRQGICTSQWWSFKTKPHTQYKQIHAFRVVWVCDLFFFDFSLLTKYLIGRGKGKYYKKLKLLFVIIISIQHHYYYYYCYYIYFIVVINACRNLLYDFRANHLCICVVNFFYYYFN